MTTLRVLVADDDALIRDVVRDVLDAEPDITVVGLAADADEAIELAGKHRPAVVVLDVRMPGGGGIRAASGITERSPGTAILAFSAYADRAAAAALAAVGVADYLVKGVPNAALVAAVRRLGGQSAES